MEEFIDNISEKIAANICGENHELEIVTYGIHQMIVMMLNIMFTVISGIVWHELFFFVVMSLYFSVLRPYVGGYHAETEEKCLIISIILVNLILFCRRYFVLGIPAYIIMWLVSMAVILLWAPIGNPNKELDILETRIYKRKSQIIMVIGSFAIIISILFEWKILAEGISSSMFLTAVLLTLGKIKYRTKTYIFT